MCKVVAGGGVEVTVAVALGRGAGKVAAGVLLVLRDGATAVKAASGWTDDRVLPQWPSDGLFALVPGEEKVVVIGAGGGHSGSKSLSIGVEGWNVEAMTARVEC